MGKSSVFFIRFLQIYNFKFVALSYSIEVFSSNLCSTVLVMNSVKPKVEKPALLFICFEIRLVRKFFKNDRKFYFTV